MSDLPPPPTQSSEESSGPFSALSPPAVAPPAPAQWQVVAWRPLPSHPRATLALVLGIVSVVGVFIGVTLVLGPMAWYLGASTMREIDRDPLRWDGRSSAKAGLVMGIIATVLLVGLLLVLLLVAGISAALGSIDTGY